MTELEEMAPQATRGSAPLTLVDRNTEVRSLRFRYIDTETLSPSELRDAIALTDRGRLYGLRRTLSFLPLIDAPGPHPFTPVELARDAVRLERFYRRNGFLQPEVDWFVNLDTTRNTVSVMFNIREGPPLLIRRLTYETPEGELARVQFPDELLEEWDRFRRRADLQSGERVDVFRLIQVREDAVTWARDRGYPHARSQSRVNVDSLANRVDVTVVLDAGPRATVSEILVEGNESVPDRVVRRELPFREGDLFEQRRLVWGQREVFGLDIFRIALAEVPEQERDSTVAVRIRVREAQLRGVSGQTGYLSGAGLTAQAEWRHRNFLGDARTFTAAAIANTGFAAIDENPNRRYRASVSLRQPYFFDRRISATGSLFSEYRDDRQDRSRAFGGDVTALWERRQFENVALSYRIEDRRVQEFRGLGSTDEAEFSFIDLTTELLGAVSTNLSSSVVSADATYGRLDDAITPRSGFILRPSAQITTPFPQTAVEFSRLGLNVSGYAPLGQRLTLHGRAGGGRLIPFRTNGGEDEAEILLDLLRFREQLFRAGGTADVRGWGTQQLGPKVLNLLFRPAPTEDDPDGVAVRAVEYYAYGGTERLTATAEARYALNDFLGVFAFLDAGRLRSPERSLQPEDGSVLFDETFGATDRVFFGTGGGVTLASPIGAVQLGIGYKLNPSFFDVRSPRAIGDAINDLLQSDPDPSFDDFIEAARTVEPTFWRRIGIHLSIGQTF